MVKLGLYGLLRVLTLLGEPDPVWGAALLGVGLVSAAYGALAVLAQRDLKRLLAYSTVENVGISAVGLGLGLLAAASGSTSLAALALAGGLLHVWNHALFKSLLFLAAGSLASGAGALDLERLGGLLRRMPITGLGLLVGAAAICALPPLNGFVGEFLVYLGSFEALGTGSPLRLPALAAIAGLGFVGALAAAGFVRAAGIALLGQPRSAEAAGAREVATPMRAVLLALAALCLLLGVAGPLGLAAATPAVDQLLPAGADATRALRAASAALWRVGAAGAAVTAIVLAMLWLRVRVLPAPVARQVGTWDCGHAAPTPRMQYSASSFAQPLTSLFAAVLRVRSSGPGPVGPFPRRASFGTRSADLADAFYARLFTGVAGLAGGLRPIQAGSPQLYVLYTVVAALALLLWKVL
jgi:formate hydrogenlyase subunit 3/multisubunit Na+/H+ antiporter MnhD subunit